MHWHYLAHQYQLVAAEDEIFPLQDAKIDKAIKLYPMRNLALGYELQQVVYQAWQNLWQLELEFNLFLPPKVQWQQAWLPYKSPKLLILGHNVALGSEMYTVKLSQHFPIAQASPKSLGALICGKDFLSLSY